MGSRELELMDGSKRVQNRAGGGVGVGGAFPRLWLVLGPGVCWVSAVPFKSWPFVYLASSLGSLGLFLLNSSC